MANIEVRRHRWELTGEGTMNLGVSYCTRCGIKRFYRFGIGYRYSVNGIMYKTNPKCNGV